MDIHKLYIHNYKTELVPLCQLPKCSLPITSTPQKVISKNVNVPNVRGTQ